MTFDAHVELEFHGSKVTTDLQVPAIPTLAPRPDPIDLKPEGIGSLLTRTQSSIGTGWSPA
jgi:hypothetical protein